MHPDSILISSPNIWPDVFNSPYDCVEHFNQWSSISSNNPLSESDVYSAITRGIMKSLNLSISEVFRYDSLNTIQNNNIVVSPDLFMSNNFFKFYGLNRSDVDGNNQLKTRGRHKIFRTVIDIYAESSLILYPNNFISYLHEKLLKSELLDKRSHNIHLTGHYCFIILNALTPNESADNILRSCITGLSCAIVNNVVILNSELLENQRASNTKTLEYTLAMMKGGEKFFHHKNWISLKQMESSFEIITDYIEAQLSAIDQLGDSFFLNTKGDLALSEYENVNTSFFTKSHVERIINIISETSADTPPEQTVVKPKWASRSRSIVNVMSYELNKLVNLSKIVEGILAHYTKNSMTREASLGDLNVQREYSINQTLKKARLKFNNYQSTLDNLSLRFDSGKSKRSASHSYEHNERMDFVTKEIDHYFNLINNKIIESIYDAEKKRDFNSSNMDYL
jgi:hypothetical protein